MVGTVDLEDESSIVVVHLSKLNVDMKLDYQTIAISSYQVYFGNLQIDNSALSIVPTNILFRYSHFSSINPTDLCQISIQFCTPLK